LIRGLGELARWRLEKRDSLPFVHPSIFQDDKPMLVIGAPGATQIAMGVLQVTLNVLDFAMSMLEAVSMPRFSATSDVIDLSNISRSVERELNILGYQTVRSPLSHTFAWVHGIKITAQGMEGGADPATDGMALSAL
jgi:gamma-glutamyltranspeptidase / glutathione hydrolase